MPAISYSVLAETCNSCNHFSECLQFSDSTADCLLILFAWGSGIVRTDWCGGFFCFYFVPILLKKNSQSSNANFCRFIWVSVVWKPDFWTWFDFLSSPAPRMTCAASCTRSFMGLCARGSGGGSADLSPLLKMMGCFSQCGAVTAWYRGRRAEFHFWDQKPTFCVQLLRLVSIHWLT